MSERMETLAGQMEWATKNMAFNLDFIPDDKMNWKPAPAALSALEIVSHLLGALAYFKKRIENPTQTQEFGTENVTVTSRDEAKTKLIAAGEEYSRLLRSLSPEVLNTTVELPFGKLPMSFLVLMPATDAIHHHGQIAYIQSLLGDAEPHFDFSLLPKVD